MRGKPQRARMELMPLQTSLIITPSRLSDSTDAAIHHDCSKQVTQENKLAQHILSQTVDSAVHFLAISRFFR